MKRDNWTNDEVINILGGLQVVRRDGMTLAYLDWNIALDAAISQFYNFKVDSNDCGAIAYNSETKEIQKVKND